MKIKANQNQNGTSPPNSGVIKARKQEVLPHLDSVDASFRLALCGLLDAVTDHGAGKFYIDSQCGLALRD